MSENDGMIERLGRLFTETFHIEAPSAETDLLENGILDSLQLVELLAQLEAHFDVRISIEDIELDDLRSLTRIARLVVRAGGAAPARRVAGSASY